MNILFTILIILIISFFLTKYLSKIKIPIVVTLIIIGLLFEIRIFSEFILNGNEPIIYLLGDLGLLCIMFLAGLESSWAEIVDERRDAMIIAGFSDIVPFVMGFFIMQILGYSVAIAVIVGICLSITAEGTTAKILLELKKLKTKVGSAMIGSGLLDDVLGIGVFIGAAYILDSINLPSFFLMGGALLAFFIGIMSQSLIGRGHNLIKKTEKFLNIFIIPFFFVSMGIGFDFKSLILNPGIVIAIIVVALIGKMLGVFLTKPFTKFSYNQLYLIGWAMNSRGAIELALALVAFKSGIIPVDVYSSLVVMALLTTVIFPFMIESIIKKHPRIMN